MNMAKTKTGALIVIQKDIALTQYIQTGDIINADVNSRLIENIFLYFQQYMKYISLINSASSLV